MPLAKTRNWCSDGWSGVFLYKCQDMNVKNKLVVELSHIVEESIYMLKNYHWTRTGTGSKPMLVFMVDKDFYTGGMADRFKGAISAYAWCKQRNIPFRIRYVYPFELADYLEAAGYDWRLREGEYTTCLKDSRLMYGRGEYARRLVRLNLRKQLHFYGNYDNLSFINEKGGTAYTWSGLFKELFRPGEELETCLQERRADIGSPYVSAVYRFQNLLGDFQEYSFKSLDNECERENLIVKCIDSLQMLHQRHPDELILVTSDSETFMNRAKELDFVRLIPGKVVHIGSKSGESSSVYMKSFVDFYMLSESTKVYGIVAGQMYPSEFPMYAAKVNDIPFERILL